MFLVSNVDDLIFEKGTKIVLREAITKYTEALKRNYCSGEKLCVQKI